MDILHVKAPDCGTFPPSSPIVRHFQSALMLPKQPERSKEREKGHGNGLTDEKAELGVGRRQIIHPAAVARTGFRDIS